MVMMKYLVFLTIFGCLMIRLVFADVVLVDKYNQNVVLSLTSVPATFAPIGDEKAGILFIAWPLDACSPLINTSSMEHAYNANYSRFLLIVDGGCSYVDKVRRAQDAGFMAAIVYNPHQEIIFRMTGDSNGIRIPAVSVSSRSGKKLLKYVGRNDIEVWLTQNYDMPTWFFMVLVALVVFILLRYIAYRIEQMNQTSPQGSRVRRFRAMRSRLVDALPSVTFTETLEDIDTSATCAICLDDYNVGDKIRILPCQHKFHTGCVDVWLTSWKMFCPVCKHDVNKSISNPQATEHTPLLSSSRINNHQSDEFIFIVHSYF